MTSPAAEDLGAVAADVGKVDRLAVINLDHLSAFTDGSRELEAELADLFLTTANRYLGGMKTALLEERSWAADVHALKGASANLGAQRVAALAAAAECVPSSNARLETLRSAVDEVACFFADRNP
ncbi:MAG: Hpt domain-containing protein [Geminicoccaceae bacterium]